MGTKYREQPPEPTDAELASAIMLADSLKDSASYGDAADCARLLKGLTVNVGEMVKREKRIVRLQLRQLKVKARMLGIKRP